MLFVGSIDKLHPRAPTFEQLLWASIEYMYMLLYVCALCINEVFSRMQTCLCKSNFRHLFRIKLKNLAIETN